MKRSLAALLLVGGLFVGCAPKPKKFFVNPRTGVRSDKILVESDIVNTWKPPVRKPRPGPISYIEPRTLKEEYSSTTGRFRVGRSEYNGIILEGQGRRYGVVKTNVWMVKGIDYYLMPPDKSNPNNINGWAEQIKESLPEITLEGRTFYVKKSWRKVHDSRKKFEIEKLPIVLLDKKKTQRMDSGSLYSEFYVPVRID